MVITNKTLKKLAPVSVVIPCYRCKDTIERAVKSVLMQTQRPTELILVDDASDDCTSDILIGIQKLYGDDWIKVILREKNGGPGAARNAGWDVAIQPFLAFLDADDAWHPRKMEIQLKYMGEHSDVDITAHRCKWVKPEEIEDYNLPYNYETFPITFSCLLMRNVIATRSVILKRDLPFRFDSKKRFSEDYLLWLSILSQGHKASLIDLELAYLYKAPYGAGGLSIRLWEMEKGELGNYIFLLRNKRINVLLFVLSSLYSLAKFMRRIIISYLYRRGKNVSKS